MMCNRSNDNTAIWDGEIGKADIPISGDAMTDTTNRPPGQPSHPQLHCLDADTLAQTPAPAPAPTPAACNDAQPFCLVQTILTMRVWYVTHNPTHRWFV